MEKQLETLKKEYENIPVPREALARVKSGINQAKKEKKVVKFTAAKKSAIGVAAAFAICFISVNSSATAAHAMESIPVIGGFFKVITIRTYDYDDGKLQMSADIPEIEDTKDSSAATVVNRDASEYIEDLLEEFKADYEGGYQGLDVDYKVVCDNDRYFSLDIAAVDTGAGAYEFHAFYTIDKTKDEVITLKDMFGENADYITPISEEILRQMKASSDTDYFIASTDEPDGFSTIGENQSFYINENNEIVICFDEYEVGPGSIGAPQFIIPRSVTSSI